MTGTGTGTVPATLLAIEGISKTYPGVKANDDVSFRVGAGEVHALLGENGAGKSTLVKMIYGLVRPDTGRMTFCQRARQSANGPRPSSQVERGSYWTVCSMLLPLIL